MAHSFHAPIDWQLVRDIRAEQLRRKRAERNQGFGINIPNAVADVSEPFPEDWMVLLREVSPVTVLHSWLLPYWYRAGGRWVLYDALPDCLIPDDETQLGSALTGKEFFAIMRGIRPSEREDFKDTVSQPISDVQHEMYRLHHVFARPFWVLQGENGGHQVNFSPDQATHLISTGRSSVPPKIGELPPCPFDARAATQLQHLNRLHQMEDSMDRLRQSGTKEWADAESQRMQREVREHEMRFIEQQMTPIVDMTMSLVHGANSRSEHDDQIIRVPDGTASKAKDAYEQYKETGNYTLRDLTGIRT